MRRPGEDSDLEQAFAALRRAEERAGPSFAALWRAAGERRRSRSGWPWRPLLQTTAAVAAGLLIVLLSLWRVRPGPTPSLTQWRPATDFLLQTPGRELLGEVPSLGRGFPLNAAAPDPVDPVRRPS